MVDLVTARWNIDLGCRGDVRHYCNRSRIVVHIAGDGQTSAIVATNRTGR